MADVCLPLSAGEDTLEAVEKQIRDLVKRQAQLRERRAALETSRTDAHKSGVSIQCAANSPTTSTPCVSLHRPGMSFTPATGHHRPWVHPQRKTRARPRVTTSPPPPPPVFETSTRNRFAPLRETERDAVIIGDSIVRHVRATLAEGKHTHCFPGGRVLNVFAQIPAILKGDESPGAMLHTGVNDTKLRQTETLKRDFKSLIETVRRTSHATTIIMSGPLPASFSRLHPSRVGAELLSDNISRTLRVTLLVSQFSNNCYVGFCSIHLNDKSTCVVKSIKTVSVPRLVRSKYYFNVGSRKNLIVIKREKC
uniref:SGNH hydrolase-type esterase domain-containing protein n=1 Tax=Sinocyclocheilus anshuiensis TaxID=1608454 RepID=A0A671QL14_9TELE